MYLNISGITFRVKSGNTNKQLKLLICPASCLLATWKLYQSTSHHTRTHIYTQRERHIHTHMNVFCSSGEIVEQQKKLVVVDVDRNSTTKRLEKCTGGGIARFPCVARVTCALSCFKSKQLVSCYGKPAATGSLIVPFVCTNNKCICTALQLSSLAFHFLPKRVCPGVYSSTLMCRSFSFLLS